MTRKMVVIVFAICSVVFPQTKAEKKAAKQAAKQAQYEAQQKANHVVVPVSDIVDGNCIVVDHITFHKDIFSSGNRLLTGILGGNDAVAAIATENIAGIIHNSCTRPIQLEVWSEYYNSSGQETDASMQNLLAVPGSTEFVSKGCEVDVNAWAERLGGGCRVNPMANTNVVVTLR